MKLTMLFLNLLEKSRSMSSRSVQDEEVERLPAPVNWTITLLASQSMAIRVKASPTM